VYNKKVRVQNGKGTIGSKAVDAVPRTQSQECSTIPQQLYIEFGCDKREAEVYRSTQNNQWLAGASVYRGSGGKCGERLITSLCGARPASVFHVQQRGEQDHVGCQTQRSYKYILNSIRW
jgi:hypothetical protein